MNTVIFIIKDVLIVLFSFFVVWIVMMLTLWKSDNSNEDCSNIYDDETTED